MKTLKLIGWLLLPLLLSSCLHTVAPKSARAKQPSYSATPDATGNYQTSGVLGWRTNHDLVIDSTGRATYNTLIARGYGTTLTPALQPTNTDFGLQAYTNDPVEPLNIGHSKVSKPFPNPGGLRTANPLAQDDWQIMTEKSRQPVANHPP